MRGRAPVQGLREHLIEGVERALVLIPGDQAAPERPRPLNREKSSRHEPVDSVQPSEQPITSRPPDALTPTATRTATFS